MIAEFGPSLTKVALSGKETVFRAKHLLNSCGNRLQHLECVFYPDHVQDNNENPAHILEQFITKQGTFFTQLSSLHLVRCDLSNEAFANLALHTPCLQSLTLYDTPRLTQATLENLLFGKRAYHRLSLTVPLTDALLQQIFVQHGKTLTNFESDYSGNSFSLKTAQLMMELCPHHKVFRIGNFTEEAKALLDKQD